MRQHAVTLRSNGAYWQAAYRDDFGRECRISLGPKAKLTKGDARRRCHEIANAEAVATGPLTLEAWGDRYIQLRGELAESTISRHKLALWYLKEKFGGSVRIDRITPAHANDFIAWMRTRNSRTSDKLLSDFSVHSMVTLAKEIMEWAARDGRVVRSPFAGLRIKVPKIQRKRQYISVERVAKVIEHCPTAGWRVMWGLTRLAGLRAAEAMHLRQDEIDRTRAVLTVWPRGERQTTKQAVREVPICPELMRLIDEAQETAPEGESLVAWGVLTGRNYNHVAREVMEKAGDSWPEPFKGCRASLETDWQTKHPALAVASWLGHDIRVSLKHYFQDSELTSRVTGIVQTVTGKPAQAQEAIR